MKEFLTIRHHVQYVLVLFCLLVSPVWGTDIAGSSDHSILSRFPETTIVAYEHRNHDIAWVPSTTTVKNGLTEGKWEKGDYTWIVYQAPENRSTLEIFRNYETALKAAGFEVSFSCKKEGCGPNFIRQMLKTSNRMVGGSERWVPDTGRYMAARLTRENGDVWVSLLIYQRNQQGVAVIRQEVIESNSPTPSSQLKGTNVGTKSVNYDEARMAAGVVENKNLKEVLDLEGEIEWRAFRYEKSISAYEVFASWKENLEESGFKVEFQCILKWCGSRFIRKVVDLNGNIIGGGEKWSQDSGFYFLAKYLSPEKTKYVSLLSYRQPNGLTVSRALSVVPQVPEFDLITVTGESLADEIEKTGRVAVYGIYFDTDQSEIKPESAPTLTEIARLLELRPELALYVDGHSDDQGTEEYNLELSARRAGSVVIALVQEHGIDEGRLQARGLGESQPVASNDSEDGRSWNRRVELVARERSE